LDDFRALTDADVRPDRRGIVIAEGVNVVERSSPRRTGVRAVVGDALPRRAVAHRGCARLRRRQVLLSDVVGFRVTRGVLASADRPAPSPVPLLLAGARRVAVLESLNDFENLGALFRNAAAFGVDAVLLDPQCADPLYAASVRVSMGHVFRVPFRRRRRLARRAEILARQRIHGAAMTPRDGAVPLRDVAPPRQVGGAARRRRSRAEREAMAAADTLVRIPMGRRRRLAERRPPPRGPIRAFAQLV